MKPVESRAVERQRIRRGRDDDDLQLFLDGLRVDVTQHRAYGLVMVRRDHHDRHRGNSLGGWLDLIVHLRNLSRWCQCLERPREMKRSVASSTLTERPLRADCAAANA